MSEGAFHFILVLIAGVTVVMFIEWLYKRYEPTPDEREKRKHQELMKEIRKHKDNDQDLY